MEEEEEEKVEEQKKQQEDEIRATLQFQQHSRVVLVGQGNCFFSMNEEEQEKEEEKVLEE